MNNIKIVEIPLTNKLLYTNFNPGDILEKELQDGYIIRSSCAYITKNKMQEDFMGEIAKFLNNIQSQIWDGWYYSGPLAVYTLERTPAGKTIYGN